jgi:hypothetical protein
MDINNPVGLENDELKEALKQHFIKVILEEAVVSMLDEDIYEQTMQCISRNGRYIDSRTMRRLLIECPSAYMVNVDSKDILDNRYLGFKVLVEQGPYFEIRLPELRASDFTKYIHEGCLKSDRTVMSVYDFLTKNLCINDELVRHTAIDIYNAKLKNMVTREMMNLLGEYISKEFTGTHQYYSTDDYNFINTIITNVVDQYIEANYIGQA